MEWGGKGKRKQDILFAYSSWLLFCFQIDFDCFSSSSQNNLLAAGVGCFQNSFWKDVPVKAGQDLRDAHKRAVAACQTDLTLLETVKQVQKYSSCSNFPLLQLKWHLVKLLLLSTLAGVFFLFIFFFFLENLMVFWKRMRLIFFLKGKWNAPAFSYRETWILWSEYIRKAQNKRTPYYYYFCHNF